MSTPNGQKVQIMLEELHEVYGTEWTQTLMYIALSIIPATRIPFDNPVKGRLAKLLPHQQHHDQRAKERLVPPPRPQRPHPHPHRPHPIASFPRHGNFG